MGSMANSPDRLAFNPLKYLQSREHGVPIQPGWKNAMYSSLYTHFSNNLRTPPPPCDGQDWGSVFGFGFSPDGSLLAAACEKKCLLLYDPINMRLIKRKFNVHNDCVNCVKFLDNRLFATCSDDHSVRLWDMRSLKQEVRILEGHSSWVKNIEYAPSTGKLVTSGFDGNVFSWDINNYSESQGHPQPLLYIYGIMRTVLTPAADKMIISTQGGYFVLIHNLDLEHLKSDMKGFKPHLRPPPDADSSGYKHMFTRERNKVEFMGDFPENDKAESISTMEVHPQGWCVASRNTTLDGKSEWTCVHDIQPASRSRKEKKTVSLNGCDSDRDGKSDAPSGPSTSSGSSQSTPTVSLSRKRQVASLGSRSRLDSDSSLSSEALTGIGMSMYLLQSGLGDGEMENSDSSSDNSSEGNEDESRATRNGNISEDTSWFDEDDDDEEEYMDDRSAGTSQSVRHSPPRQSSSSAATTSTSETSSTPLGQTSPDTLPSSSHSPQRSSLSTVQNLQDIVLDARMLLLQNVIGSSSFHFNQGSALGHLSDTCPRLLFHLKEPNVGSGFIKEQSFSPDGRVLASPFGNFVRLLAFNDSCMELCDCVPSTPRPLQEVAMVGQMKSIVLASTFSPTHALFVQGGKDGTIGFCSPKL